MSCRQGKCDYSVAFHMVMWTVMIFEIGRVLAKLNEILEILAP